MGANSSSFKQSWSLSKMRNYLNSTLNRNRLSSTRLSFSMQIFAPNSFKKSFPSSSKSFWASTTIPRASLSPYNSRKLSYNNILSSKILSRKEIKRRWLDLSIAKRMKWSSGEWWLLARFTNIYSCAVRIAVFQIYSSITILTTISLRSCSWLQPSRISQGQNKVRISNMLCPLCETIVSKFSLPSWITRSDAPHSIPRIIMPRVSSISSRIFPRFRTSRSSLNWLGDTPLSYPLLLLKEFWKTNLANLAMMIRWMRNKRNSLTLTRRRRKNVYSPNP